MTATQQAGSSRLASLDAFRGLTMILMVLVNSAGSDAVYTQFEHTAWHGLTLADVIFPSFVWIVGITTTLSLRSRVRTVPRNILVKQVFWRAAKMYILGVCLYAAPRFSWTSQRLTGVLQRIAICYLVGSLLYLFTTRRTQIFWIIGLLAGYWAIMTLIPAPGFARGDLSVEGNLAHYVDRIVLGTHNYVQTKTWDPEGILSTIPAIASMLLGMMAGYELQRETTLAARLKRMAVAGLVLLVAGLVVSHWFPINKKLWTTSFVLVVAGIDCLLLPVFTWLIDIKGRERLLKPLVIMGMNAITIYLLSEFLDLALSVSNLKPRIFQICFQPLATPPMASFFYAAAYTLLMYGAAYLLYRKRIFLRI